MNELLAVKKVSSFTAVLRAYRQAGVSLGDVIDGGAGSGSTAKTMLSALEANATCFAFEPFPGNHRFFEGADPRIVLIPKALAEEKKTARLTVGYVVPEDSEWGRRGMAGYSSVGFLADAVRPGDQIFDVEGVRADEEIPTDRTIGVIKLDLQGGELNALRGMTRLLGDVRIMWIEYTGQPGLVDFLEGRGYMLFDTEYLFTGEPSDAALAHFDASKRNVGLSTGKRAWFGFKRKAWKNMAVEFSDFRKRFQLVQTDLACVNRRYIDDFIRAAQYL